jgi:hypothetical protein
MNYNTMRKEKLACYAYETIEIEWIEKTMIVLKKKKLDYISRCKIKYAYKSECACLVFNC